MQSLPYVYIQSERLLYTVGHYSPAGWLPESDHPSADSAAARVNYLNGGPAPKPERPTGPTPAYVRELEAEALALAAERNALRDKLTSLAALIEGVADDDVDCPFCLVVGDRDHRVNCLVNVARAAAKEAQS